MAPDRTRTLRFFLQRPPEDGEPPRLAEDEVTHALRVLRVREGENVTGLDGCGRAWPLRVSSVGRRELGLECVGEPEHEPTPGTPGSRRPRLELAVAWPRGPRADEMVSMLTQLGVAAIRPLATRWSGPQDPDGKARRRERVAREACKQSGNLWLPRLDEPCTVEELAAGATHLAVLAPRVTTTLPRWLDGLPSGAGSPESPLTCAVGPEGGFDEEESRCLREHGAEVRVADAVLRIETAAVAAASVVMAARS